MDCAGWGLRGSGILSMKKGHNRADWSGSSASIEDVVEITANRDDASADGGVAEWLAGRAKTRTKVAAKIRVSLTDYLYGVPVRPHLGPTDKAGPGRAYVIERRVAPMLRLANPIIVDFIVNLNIRKTEKNQTPSWIVSNRAGAVMKRFFDYGKLPQACFLTSVQHF